MENTFYQIGYKAFSDYGTELKDVIDEFYDTLHNTEHYEEDIKNKAE
jgi:hypothetical protein